MFVSNDHFEGEIVDPTPSIVDRCSIVADLYDIARTTDDVELAHAANDLARRYEDGGVPCS